MRTSEHTLEELSITKVAHLPLGNSAKAIVEELNFPGFETTLKSGPRNFLFT